MAPDMVELQDILKAIVSAGGKPYLVGGYVRDKILGIPSKDIDVEVFGLTYTQLISVLEKFGKPDLVGESFGVIKLGDFDFSLPRRDSKNGVSHKDFDIQIDHSMTIEEAASRRDFTINSMSIDVDGNIIDPFNGVSDLREAELVPLPKFTEDPLRVLRGFQFAGRFGLFASVDLGVMCKAIKSQLSTLPKERIFAEWYKWAEKSVHHKYGFWYLSDIGWTPPEIRNLCCPQDPEWHPEGTAYRHTYLVVEAMNDICGRENITGDDKVVLILAALCHDMGKAVTTEFIDGRWRSPGHDKAGVPIAKEFLESIGCFPSLIERILPLVGEHMAHLNEVNPRTVKRLSVRLGAATIKELVLLIEADHSGRPPLPKGLPDSAALILEIAAQLNLEKSKPTPIIMGRDLIKIGLSPGVHFGKILKQCFEHQLDGVLTEENKEKYLFNLRYGEKY